MKKILLAAAIALGVLQVTTQNVQAQVSVNINIGNQPAWGPVGYDYVQFYYIPEINAYYDVMTGQYIYLQNRRWIHARALPPRYRHVDLYRTYKVVVNQPYAYKYNHQHQRNYNGYRNHRNQIVLRDNRNYQQYQQRQPARNNYGPRNDHRDRLHQQNRPMANQQKPQNNNQRNRSHTQQPIRGQHFSNSSKQQNKPVYNQRGNQNQRIESSDRNNNRMGQRDDIQRNGVRR